MGELKRELAAETLVYLRTRRPGYSNEDTVAITGARKASTVANTGVVLRRTRLWCSLAELDLPCY